MENRQEELGQQPEHDGDVKDLDGCPDRGVLEYAPIQGEDGKLGEAQR